MKSLLFVVKLWQENLKNARFRWLFALGLLSMILAAQVISRAIAAVDRQKGYFLADPLLEFFPDAVDLSNWIFFITYSSATLAVLSSGLAAPRRLVAFTFSFALMQIIRSFTMFLIPLEPPKGMILLLDPFVNNIVRGGVVASKDLFFSGHCATAVIFYFTAHHTHIKKWLLLMCVILPLLIMWQRVHYTIDIVVGVAVGVALYKLVYAGVNVWLDGGVSVKRQLSGGHL